MEAAPEKKKLVVVVVVGSEFAGGGVWCLLGWFGTYSLRKCMSSIPWRS